MGLRFGVSILRSFGVILLYFAIILFLYFGDLGRFMGGNLLKWVLMLGF